MTIDNRGEDPAAALLAQILERADYTVLQRDTLIAADAVVAGDAIVLESRVTLEGRVEGAVAVIGGSLFVRPRAVVTGPIAVFGIGAVVPSGLAEMGEVVHLRAGRSVEVERSAGGIHVTVRESPPPPTFYLPDVYGFGIPTYERVNGLSLLWGVEARFAGRDTARVAIGGAVAYRTERERLDGRLEAVFRPSGRTLVSLRGARGTRTTETWIRGSLANSLSSIGVRSDVRDYFDTEEVALTIQRLPPPPLVEGERFIAPRVMGRVSRDRSIPTGDPWSLFGDDEWRVNPPIDEGVLASVVGGATMGWRGPTSALSGQVAIEWAPGVIGDFEFAQFSATGSWVMEALWRHQIQVDAFTLLPIGSREAPLQRWSFVGGPGTLPADSLAFMRGDHVIFVRSLYFAPLRGLSLPVVGEPALRFEHAAAAAWRTGDPMPDLEQNVGVGVQFNMIHAVVLLNAAERPRDYRFTLGITVPGERMLPIF